MIKNLFRHLHISYLRWKATNLSSLPKAIDQVLIVAPHPDDEVIGCGGLIARLVSEGFTPQIVMMTGGEGSHEHCCNVPKGEIIQARRGLTRKALQILGVPEENIHELNYPDGGISLENMQTNELKRFIGDLKPQTVFIPHWGEGWQDHVKTAEILKNIVVPANVAIYEYCVWMWYYNVWRGLDWCNAYSLRMNKGEHRRKLRAIDEYVLPKAPCGKPWSGVLPPIFIKANQWNKELYFKVR